MIVSQIMKIQYVKLYILCLHIQLLFLVSKIMYMKQLTYYIPAANIEQSIHLSEINDFIKFTIWTRDDRKYEVYNGWLGVNFNWNKLYKCSVTLFLYIFHFSTCKILTQHFLHFIFFMINVKKTDVFCHSGHQKTKRKFIFK